MTLRAVCVAAGIVMLLTLKWTEKALRQVLKTVCRPFIGKRGGAEDKADREDTYQKIEPEEDPLDNKMKWRLVVAGYVFFIIFAVFAVFAIFTLNNKLNSLDTAIKNLEESSSESQAP